MLYPLCLQAESTPESTVGRFFATVSDDYSRHYAPAKLKQLGFLLAGAGVLANTQLDEDFQDYYRSDVKGDSATELATRFRHVGDSTQLKYAAPVYLSAMLAGGYSGLESRDNVIATWGGRSLRTILTGAPQHLMLTHLLGAHRPEEGNPDWRPLNDGNGVSGHAFYGAVPFITAARMADSKWLKAPLYLTSVLPGVARIDQEKHYLSQVFLGWSLAWLAADTVASAPETDKNRLVMTLTPYSDGFGISFLKTF